MSIYIFQVIGTHLDLLVNVVGVGWWMNLIVATGTGSKWQALSVTYMILTSSFPKIVGYEAYE